jgi:hypothetical protein
MSITRSVGVCVCTHALKALVVARHLAVTNELDLGAVRDRLEVWVENALLLAARLVVAVAVRLGRGVKRLRLLAGDITDPVQITHQSHLKLLLGGELEVAEQEDLVLRGLSAVVHKHVADLATAHTLYSASMISSMTTSLFSGSKPCTSRPNSSKYLGSACGEGGSEVKLSGEAVTVMVARARRAGKVELGDR